MDLIRGNGPETADLMIIGDYARKADEVSQECLSGFYRRKCDDYLKDAGYGIDKAYRTCILKYYEKGLGVGTYSQDKKILAALYDELGCPEEYWINLIIDEINSIKPAIIILLGEFSLRALTGRDTIGNFRGSVLPLIDYIQSRCSVQPKAVATLHPIIEHKDESSKYLIRMDFQKAVDLLYQPNRRINDHRVVIAKSTHDYLNFRQQYSTNPEWMVSDIETHLGFITCASFAFDGRQACTIPMVGGRIDTMEKCRMSRLLALDLENPLIKKSNQNIGYDKRIYQRFGYRVNPVKWDTMLAAHTIAPEFPKRLGFLTSIYTDMSYYKDEGKDFDSSKHSYDQLYEYCGKDSISTFQIMEKQMKELDGMESLEFFNDFVMPLFDLYYDLESVGILLDTECRDRLERKYESMYELKKLELDAITVGYNLNLNSPTQIGKYIEAEGFPVLRHQVDSGFRVVNTDVESFRKMRSMPAVNYKSCKLPYQTALRFLDLVLLIRRIDKILQYVAVGIHPWGRVHTNVRIGATTSARTANSYTADQIPQWVIDKGKRKIKLKPLGANFQTLTKRGFIIEGVEDDDIEEGIIGKDVREMYIPDKNWAIVEGDRSQAEARVVDLLAEDYESLEEYGRIDKHCRVASFIFDEFTYEDIFRMAKVEKSDEGEHMRFIGKKGKHATNYDMGDFRLSTMANIDIKFAKEILRKLDKAYPQVKSVFHKQVEDEIRKTRKLFNPYGRIRMFFKKLDSHGIKVGYSWFPQSTISDGTKLAMRRIRNTLDQTKAFLIAENHDSITALVHHTYIRQYIYIAKPLLEEGIDFRKGVFPRDYNLVIPSEWSIGRKNWGQLKEIRMKKLRIAT